MERALIKKKTIKVTVFLILDYRIASIVLPVKGCFEYG